jgi:GT2 family glycosyltransferase
MPCRGRAEQTVANVRRLLATAGTVEWELVCIDDGDPHVREALTNADLPIRILGSPGRRGYWHALNAGMYAYPAPLLCGLANDLLPGQHWLQRAVAAFDQEFGGGPGLLGFNDGHHQVEHSPHFLISRSLLDRYGGWPVHYDHNYGDTELCQRAIADGLYAKAPWAVLYHNHPYFGGADDSVYAEGRARSDRDLKLFNERKASGWPRVFP